MEKKCENTAYKAFEEYFSNVEDPRQPSKVKHLLEEVLFITVLAVISGCDDFNEIAEYAHYKQAWLKTFLKLPGGTPTHDTFNRVLCLINPAQFRNSFIGWIDHIRNGLRLSAGEIAGGEQHPGEVICIDGKTVCGSKDRHADKKPIHMVSAYASEQELVLGQLKCYEKSNEITAIPELLDMLDIEGAIITIDAMGCQKKIAETILNKKADYILAVKDNQGNLHKEITDMFSKADTPAFSHYLHECDTWVEKDHGRVETRECKLIRNLGWLYEIQSWKGVECILKITSSVLRDGKTIGEERFYISSIQELTANAANRAVRKHWHIENKLHWVLDMVFKEDYARARTENAAENLTTIRKIALNAMKLEKSDKCSLKIKRKKAGWDDSYALKILLNIKM